MKDYIMKFKILLSIFFLVVINQSSGVDKEEKRYITVSIIRRDADWDQIARILMRRTTTIGEIIKKYIGSGTAKLSNANGLRDLTTDETVESCGAWDGTPVTNSQIIELYPK